MALQVCAVCSTRYAPAAQCPHCGANEWQPDYVEEAAPVAPEAAVELPDPTPPVDVDTPAPVSTPRKSSPASSAPDDADVES